MAGACRVTVATKRSLLESRTPTEKGGAMSALADLRALVSEEEV